MECTKIMLSTRVYALMSIYGMEIFEAYLDRCYDMGRQFAEIILSDPKFELAVFPQSNIVCFSIKGENTDDANTLNRKIRQLLLEDGSFYIVQTVLKEKVYLRVSIMNPFTKTTDLEALLDRIKELLGK